MLSIIPNIFIESNRAFKTKKEESIIYDTLLPINNFEITDLTIKGEGDKIILKHPDFLLPISKTNFKEIIQTTSTLNGVINDTFAIVSKDKSLYLIKYHSEEYNLLRIEYEDSLSQKFIKQKEINIGDIVSFTKGLQEFSNFTYLGERFFFPFTCYSSKGKDRHNFRYFPDNRVVKKHIFAKVDNNIIEDYCFLTSFPKIKNQEVSFNSLNIPNLLSQITKSLEEIFINYIQSKLDIFFFDYYISEYIETENILETNKPTIKHQRFSYIKENMAISIYLNEPTLDEAKNDYLYKLKMKEKEDFLKKIKDAQSSFTSRIEEPSPSYIHNERFL